MTLIKEQNATSATRTLLANLGVLFFVIFPIGVLVLVTTKFFVWLIFYGFDVSEAFDGLVWLFSPDTEDEKLWQMEACTLMNCTAAFVALVVFMIRALLKVGELPSAIDGMITLHVRLGFRMVALPLLTVLVCAISSFAIFFIFSSVDNYVDTYFRLSMIVLLPTAIGTWIWVWRGEWITSIPQQPAESLQAPNVVDTEPVIHDSE